MSRFSIRTTMILTFLGFCGVQLFTDISIMDYVKTIWTEKSSTENKDKDEPKDKDKGSKFSISQVIISLKDMVTDSEKVQSIEDKIDFMPDSLSLEELNTVLELFISDSSKVRVTKIFHLRIKDFSDNELKKFMSLFITDSSRREASNLLFRRK